MKANGKYLTAVLCLVILLGFTGCSSSNRLSSRTRIESGYCDPPVIYSYDDADSERMPFISNSLDSTLLKKYSFRTLLVANAVGVLLNLQALEKVDAGSSLYLHRKEQILMRLLLVSTEISSVAAELDCEGERARQVAGFVQEKESKRVRALTAFSITVGAMAGVVNAAAPADQTAQTVAITGGIIGAAVGLSALFPSNRILFNHPRNLLADLWTEEANSMVYPSAVWYMLNEKFFSNSQEFPIAKNLKQRWIKFEGFDKNNKKGERLCNLFFGPGGYYSADELNTRVRMLNQLQAAVKLMNQDLLGLIGDMSKGT